MRFRRLALPLLLITAQTAFAQMPAPPRLGPPPTPPIVEEPRYAPPSRFHVWIDGYWLPFGNDYTWYNGYWTVPPYYGARWVAPHYDAPNDRYYYGYWNGDRIRQYRTFRPEQYESSPYVTSDSHFDGLLNR